MFFKCLKVDIVSSYHAVAGLLFGYMNHLVFIIGDNPAVELMTLVAAICLSSFKQLC